MALNHKQEHLHTDLCLIVKGNYTTLVLEEGGTVTKKMSKLCVCEICNVFI